jgi:hypothetical protein
MSWKIWYLLLSVSCCVTGCAVLNADGASSPSVIYRHRFVGTESVADLPVKPKAFAILSTTNAIAFRHLAEARFSAWIAKSSGKAAASNPHLAKALDLLLLSDSAVEISQSGSTWTGLFAAHLAAGEGETFIREIQTAAGDLGLSDKNTTAHLTAKRDGEWVVALAGTGKAPAVRDLESRIKALIVPSSAPKGSPDSNAVLLKLEADLPALSKLGGWAPSPVKLGRLNLTLTAQKEFLKTEGSVTFPGRLSWSNTPWNVPTNLVHDPLVAFTAIRDLGPLAADTGMLSDFLGDGLKQSQAFHWTLSEVPFQTYFAIASAQPSRELGRLSETLPMRWNPVLAADNSGVVGVSSNKASLEIEGLSLVVPKIAVTNDASGDWLAGGLVPMIPTRKPIPAPEGLLSQFTRRKDVVVYDWEITQERVGYWRVLSQLVPVLGQKTSLLDPAVAQRRFIVTERFLQEIADQLGNTITEMTVSGPNELAISRKSHLGMTGFEIVYFARWLADSPASLASSRRARTPSSPTIGHP